MDETKDKVCLHSLPGIYQPRHPENTELYQIFQEYLETWITQTSPARGPLGWGDYNQDMPVDDVNGQSIPEYEFNQYVSW